MAVHMPTVFTIGHSSRTLPDFLALLAESEIACVVDVRRLPGSRAFPHFDAAPLQAALQAQGIDYWHPDALGGRRGKRESGDAGGPGFWSHPAFAHYAAWAEGEAFSDALQQLIQRARTQRCALMCAEAVWWRCHRRIISDHLLARGVEVRHIMGPGKTTLATLTPGAMLVAGTVRYPAPPNPQPCHPEMTTEAPMPKTFRIGDHVRWNSEAGVVSGHITAVHRANFQWKGHIRHCSESDPQYEIRSDKSTHVAMHHGSALELLAR